MVSISLSVVIPVYQGESFLEDLADALATLKTELDKQQRPISLIEAIFVDDEATDNSAKILDALQERHPWIAAVHLSRNVGQHSATVAGILRSCGDWVATIDEDLQHDPKFLVPLLMQAIENHLDIVYAKPESAVHESVLRDFSSRTVKRLFGFLTRNPHVTKFNSFRMIRGPLARAAASLATERTYFDIALTWFSNRIGVLTIPMKDQRYVQHRTSGYSLKSLVRHAVRLALGCEMRILRAGTLIGFATLSVSVLLSAAVLSQKLLFPETVDLPGWSSLMLAVLFLGGLVASLVGISLEYLSVLVLQALGKPTYYVVDRSLDDAVLEHFRRDAHDIAA